MVRVVRRLAKQANYRAVYASQRKCSSCCFTSFRFLATSFRNVALGVVEFLEESLEQNGGEFELSYELDEAQLLVKC